MESLNSALALYVPARHLTACRHAPLEQKPVRHGAGLPTSAGRHVLVAVAVGQTIDVVTASKREKDLGAGEHVGDRLPASVAPAQPI